MPHDFMVWGCLLGDKVTRTMEHYDKRTNVYIIVSGRTWKCFAESMNVRVKGYFYILWKIWQQLA